MAAGDMGAARSLRICHLYPDLLNLYGDRGNILTLVRRARWRGLGAEVTEVSLKGSLTVRAHDLYFIGGGEDRQQALVAADLRGEKGAVLREAAAEGAVVLAVCGGYQLLGQYYRPAEGEDLPGIGLLDITTRHPGKARPRLIGNIVIHWEPSGRAGDGGRVALVGFENHGGRTHLGAGARPLGRVVAGHGNNGEDGWEGAVSGHVYGTYLHGPLLPKNPAFADHLIQAALRRRYGQDLTLPPLDDARESEAHQTMLRRILSGRR